MALKDLRDRLAGNLKGEVTVREKYLDGVRSIQHELENYWLNYAFAEGNQWTYWVDGESDLSDFDDLTDRFQAVVNRTRANMRYLTANILQRPLKFSVLPSATDDASLRAARSAEALLEGLRKQQQWETLREESTAATLKGGTAALAVEWDEFSEATKVTPLGISEFIVEPGVKRYQDARWWIKVQALPVQQVQDMFPDHFNEDNKPPADARSGISPYRQNISGLSNSSQPVDLTLVLTYYERPHQGNPEGKWAVEVGEQILDEGEWPYDFEELNLVVFRETINEDKWTGSSFMNDVRRVQAMLNILWTQVAEHVRNVGTGRVLVPQSAWDIVTQTFTDEPGQLVPWPDGMERPEFMNPPSFGAYIERLLDRCADYIDDIMGVHDVSRGKAPGSIESGYGVQILDENDTSPVGRMVREHARGWSRIGQMVLSMYEQRGSSQKVTVDMGLGPERLDFKPMEDLRGERDVVIPDDALIPRSRAAQESRAKELLQMGVITDMATYARVADLADAHDIISAVDPDAAKAMRENEMMAEGNNEHADLILGMDNHDTHQRIHGDFIKSRRFELLPEQDKQDALNHYKAHGVMKAEADAEMQKRAATDALMQDTLSGGAAAPQQQQPAPPEPQLPPELANPEALGNDLAAAIAAEFPGA